jgi:hypothetical protein
MVEWRLAVEKPIEIGEVSAPVPQVHREYYKKEIWVSTGRNNGNVMLRSDCHVNSRSEGREKVARKT